QARKRNRGRWGRGRRGVGRPRPRKSGLLSRQRSARPGLGDRVALVELSGAESPAIDRKALDASGVLGQRLTQNRRATVGGGALAGRGGAIPDDVAGNEPLGRRDDRLGGVTCSKRRSAGEPG